jgi:flagellin-specific chaperone FliS
LDEINSNFENLTSDSTKNLNEQLQEKQNILAKLQVDLNLEKAEKVK